MANPHNAVNKWVRQLSNALDDRVKKIFTRDTYSFKRASQAHARAVTSGAMGISDKTRRLSAVRSKSKDKPGMDDIVGRGFLALLQWCAL